jgi:hypothetical protein
VLRIAYFKGEVDECGENCGAGFIFALETFQLFNFLKSIRNKNPGPRSSALKHKSKLPQQKIKLLNDLDEIYGKILRTKKRWKENLWENYKRLKLMLRIRGKNCV